MSGLAVFEHDWVKKTWTEVVVRCRSGGRYHCKVESDFLHRQIETGQGGMVLNLKRRDLD